MLKKPSLLLSSYGCLQNSRGPYQPASTLPPAKSSNSYRTDSRDHAQYQCWRIAQWRNYTDARPPKDSHTPDDLRWPDSQSATAIPTPYEIFKQKKGAPYSKRRFYELVKMYHPDRNSHEPLTTDCISHTVKLERYRLIVAANDILSDPEKRSAYDRYGTGWAGQPELGLPRNAWGRSNGEYWSGFDPNSPAQNATWEDWERWYQRDTKGKQEPTVISNEGFVSLVVLFAVLGGVYEVTRAGSVSKTFLEQLEARHDKSSKEIARRKQDSLELGNKQERVQSFLMNRDPVGYGITDPQEERYRKLLPAPEVCMSSDIETRGSNA